MATEVWLVGLLLVTSQPRVLAMIVNVSIGGCIGLNNYCAVEGSNAAATGEGDVGAPPRTRVVSIKVQRVSVWSLAVGGISVLRSDGASASFGRVALVLRRQRQQRQPSGQDGEGLEYPGNGHWRPVLVRLDGVKMSAPPPPLPSTAADKARRRRHEKAHPNPSKTTTKKAIGLPSVGIWGARLVALEVGDLRVDVGVPAGTTSSDRHLRPKRPDDGVFGGGAAAAAAADVRSVELAELRVVGLFSARPSCMSVSAGGYHYYCCCTAAVVVYIQ